MMKPILRRLASAIIIFGFPVLASAVTFPMSVTGQHVGEAPPIEYSIEYHAPQGVTTAGETGIVFTPFFYSPSFLPTILPERYFGNYPLYFSGAPFAFTVHLKNIGKRTYRNLMVVAVQEYLNPDGVAGVAFPDDTVRSWYLDEFTPGKEVSFQGYMTLPYSGTSGLDQTHLQVIHWEGKDDDKKNIGSGRVLLDDPQAGIWCPVGQS